MNYKALKEFLLSMPEDLLEQQVQVVASGFTDKPCITGPFGIEIVGFDGIKLRAALPLNPDPIWSFDVTGHGCVECGKDADVCTMLLKTDPDVPAAYETLTRCKDCS